MIAAAIILGITTAINAAVACFVFYMGQKERDLLLTRIQAPEASRLKAVSETFDNMPDAPVDDDVALPALPWDEDLQMILSEEDN